MPDWIKYIEGVRSDNNILWMDILRIALQHAPERTKMLLRRIRENDLDISEATGKIADDN